MSEDEESVRRLVEVVVVLLVSFLTAALICMLPDPALVRLAARG